MQMKKQQKETLLPEHCFGHHEGMESFSGTPNTGKPCSFQPKILALA